MGQCSCVVFIVGHCIVVFYPGTFLISLMDIDFPHFPANDVEKKCCDVNPFFTMMHNIKAALPNFVSITISSTRVQSLGNAISDEFFTSIRWCFDLINNSGAFPPFSILFKPPDLHVKHNSTWIWVFDTQRVEMNILTFIQPKRSFYVVENSWNFFLPFFYLWESNQNVCFSLA